MDSQDDDYNISEGSSGSSEERTDTDSSTSDNDIVDVNITKCDHDEDNEKTGHFCNSKDNMTYDCSMRNKAGTYKATCLSKLKM